MPRNRDRLSEYVTCKHCGRDFRAITWRHLRNIHGYDGEHPILEYKQRFRLATATCGEVRKRISESAEDLWARRGRHWTRRKLIAEIRQRHRAGKSLRGKSVPVRLYEAGRRFYGTWQGAVERAGLDYEKATGIRHWNRSKVVEEIQRLHTRGVTLYASSVEKHHPALFKAAMRQFPSSWAKALRSAGLDPNVHRQPRGKWTEQKAEEWVRTQVAKQRSLLARDAPRDLRDYLRNRGRGWIAFIESFGIPYPGVKKRRDWTKEKVLKEIRAWKRKGHRLNYRAVSREYQALIHQARKFFGSWDRARANAGA